MDAIINQAFISFTIYQEKVMLWTYCLPPSLQILVLLQSNQKLLYAKQELKTLS